jgi:hypothetical protein
MTKYIWITIGIIILVFALALKQAPNEPKIERPSDAKSQDESNTSDVSANENKEPVVSESGNIKVTEPYSGQQAISPLVVKGEARVFENAFSMRLKDSSGNVIVSKDATAQAPESGEFGSFSELLLFEGKTEGYGVLEVYSNSAKDGSEQDMVSIPVKFN